MNNKVCDKYNDNILWYYIINKTKKSKMFNWFYGNSQNTPTTQVVPTAQTVPVTRRHYGWDIHETITEEEQTKFPMKMMSYHANLSAVKEIDLSPLFPEVYDQEALGSCTANAILGAYEYTMKKENEPYVQMSRLGLYYMEREKEHPNDMSTDTGAQIKTGVNITHNSGVGLEVLWPYDISKFAEKPPDTFYDDLQYHKSVKIERIKRETKDIDQCLLDGCPVIFGFLVYSSFETPQVAQTGMVPIPDPSKEELLGGHAVCIVGLVKKNGKDYYKVRNSWSTSWGDQGHFYVEKAFMTTNLGLLGRPLCSDLWTIRRVVDNKNDPNIAETDEQKLEHVKQILNVDSKTNELEILFDGVRNLVLRVESNKSHM